MQAPPEDVQGKIDEVLRSLEHQWIKNVHSEGSNNSTTLSGMKKVFDAMHRQQPFTDRSSMIDLGSGAGLPAIYAALKYGISAYGIERDPVLVKLAQEFARQAGVQELVTFAVEEVEQLTTAWYKDRGITHVYSYDVVFSSDCWSTMFKPLAKLNLLGASSKRFHRYWPNSIQLLETVDRVMLSGNRSGFAFGIWKSVPTAKENRNKRDRSPNPSARRSSSRQLK